jgi:hypothetical protein
MAAMRSSERALSKSPFATGSSVVNLAGDDGIERWDVVDDTWGGYRASAWKSCN